jgi:hypothetical protein
VTEADPNANERFDVSKTMTLVCGIAAVACSIMMVSTWLYMVAVGRTVPDTLDRHLSAAIVFLFTGGFALVKDFIGGKT